MKILFVLLTWVTSLIVGSSALADVDSGGSEPLLCAIIDVKECIRGQECLDVLPEAINAPQFFRVHPSKRLLSSTQASGESRTSAVKYMERVSGKLVLQGVEPTANVDPDGVGWTISIDEKDGRMVGSASGSNVGFVIFGACTPM
jgi:hypothetical protein